MRIDRWLQLRRTKALCIGMAVLFGAEQAVWGADLSLIQAMQLSGQQQRQLEATLTAAVVSL